MHVLSQTRQRINLGSWSTWGVHVLRSPNFFLGEWKQIETWKLLEETWLFFRLGEANWQHCTTRWMLVTRSSYSSVFDTEMVTFTFEEQHVIIRFLHLRGMKPIEIHRQLSETCSDGVMDWKMCVHGCDSSKKAESRVKTTRPRTSRSEDEPLKKRLLRPCNRGVSVVKNVYVYRVITLRSDCIFSFWWWVVFFKKIIN